MKCKNVDLTRRILELDRPAGVVDQTRRRSTGHDRRYCPRYQQASRAWLDAGRWTLTIGLAATVEWYRANDWWWRPIKEQDPAFRAYYQTQYGAR